MEELDKNSMKCEHEKEKKIKICANHASSIYITSSYQDAIG